ncbi:MAG: metallophosphoesterase [Proteobacteria bacterium]|nr:metallophosphoesterase [Pseudomonadota bacterium]
MITIPEEIRRRLGEEKAVRRLHLEERLHRRKAFQGLGPYALERFFSVNAVIGAAVTACGLKETGLRNILDLRIEEHEVTISGLPKAFEGFRLLQLADLHCDLDDRIMDRITEAMATVPHDAVVLTGDYHTKVHRPFDRSLAAMRRLIPLLHPKRFAILGNHDFLAKVAPLEEAGLPFLLNEALPLEHHGSRLWICGIDDPHFFRTHDLARACSVVPSNEPTILLSHSPETYREAATLGYSLMLSGHTHGGQMCLPGGFPVYRNAPGCRREHLAGSWREGRMLGYTSRGSGTAGVAARFHCPPEITLHILKTPPFFPS